MRTCAVELHGVSAAEQIIGGQHELRHLDRPIDRVSGDHPRHSRRSKWRRERRRDTWQSGRRRSSAHRRSGRRSLSPWAWHSARFRHAVGVCVYAGPRASRYVRRENKAPRHQARSAAHRARPTEAASPRARQGPKHTSAARSPANPNCRQSSVMRFKA